VGLGRAELADVVSRAAPPKGLTENRLRVLRVVADPQRQVTYNYRLGSFDGLYYAHVRNPAQSAWWLWDNGFIEDTHVRVPNDHGPDAYVLGLTDKGREALA
jgi:hypothetical protein